MTVQATAIPKLAAVSEPKRRWRPRETAFALLFILPSLIGFTVFYAVPAVRGVFDQLHQLGSADAGQVRRVWRTTSSSCRTRTSGIPSR